jgi:hypothetical protein
VTGIAIVARTIGVRNTVSRSSCESAPATRGDPIRQAPPRIHEDELLAVDRAQAPARARRVRQARVERLGPDLDAQLPGGCAELLVEVLEIHRSPEA